MPTTTTDGSETEKKEILRRYRRLLRKTRPTFKDGDAKLIRRAFDVAAEAHRETRRKSGEPYIYHPLAVAEICIEEIGLGPTSVAAALLHDVVEDTEWTIEDIDRTFGPKVSRIIDGLTKISGVFTHSDSMQAENFRKMLLTLSEDMRVILIKIADRLHNMRTLGSMPQHKQLKISSETKFLYAPLAHRLGLYPIKTELEDLSLKYTEPTVYRDIAEKIKQTRTARQRFIRNFTAPIENELRKQGVCFKVKGRPKSINSIWNKMQAQRVPFEEIYDLFAIRIIAEAEPEEEKATCWRVYSIVTDFYKPNPDRLRDWISTPKANGYESLHTTVMSKAGQWVEVQIRTARMDAIAERGYAAHWKYKDNHPTDGRKNTKRATTLGLESWISKVRETLESPDASAVEFVDDFRTNLFSEEVFVFTPKGDLKTLPAGATALDFAFEIHTEVGARCLGAKVNQKLVPLSHQLSNGDQVEILTSNKQKPSEDWLKFVVSSKAIAKIKESLKEGRRQVATEGQEAATRRLRQLGTPLTDELTQKLRVHFTAKSTQDLFYRIGKGYIAPNELRKAAQKLSRSPEVLSPTSRPEAPRPPKPENDTLFIGEHSSGIDYKLARCCNPIPGDPVFGFVSVGGGTRIHRTNCPNAVGLMSKYGYRVIKAQWASQPESAFLVGLHLTGTDRLGTVNDVTGVISADLQVNMRSISVDTIDGVFEGTLSVYIHDTKHLDQLIARLKQIAGIVEVTRFDPN